jgi:hypothetical protein
VLAAAIWSLWPMILPEKENYCRPSISKLTLNKAKQPAETNNKLTLNKAKRFFCCSFFQIFPPPFFFGILLFQKNHSKQLSIALDSKKIKSGLDKL